MGEVENHKINTKWPEGFRYTSQIPALTVALLYGGIALPLSCSRGSGSLQKQWPGDTFPTIRHVTAMSPVQTAPSHFSVKEIHDDDFLHSGISFMFLMTSTKSKSQPKQLSKAIESWGYYKENSVVSASSKLFVVISFYKKLSFFFFFFSHNHVSQQNTELADIFGI